MSKTPSGIHSERLVSLDAFRGLTMSLMVLVNTAGSDAIYRQLAHAPWHGWTVADTVFPSFLWIAGLTITLSLGRKVASGAPRRELLRQAFRRSMILYSLGLLIYVAPRFDLSTQRLLGVLQRIAICYLIASTIFLFTRWRAQVAWTVGLLALYWILLLCIPVPGYGAGNLSIDGNIEHYVDRIVLGAHNYASTRTWDPEGVLSTLPAVATTLFGVLAGYLLRRERPIAEKVAWFLVTGNLLLFSGLVCSIWLPINKHIWTSSFAIFMAGIDYVVFGIMLWLVDGCGYRRYVRPFVILGMNAIAVYMVSELLAEFLGDVRIATAGTMRSLQSLIYRAAFLRFFSDQTSALLYALAFTLLMFAFAYWLHRKKWYFRI